MTENQSIELASLLEKITAIIGWENVFYHHSDELQGWLCGTKSFFEHLDFAFEQAENKLRPKNVIPIKRNK